MPYPKRDFAGQRFGRLVVVGDAPKGDNTKHRWVLCKCDCGKDYATRLGALREGRTKSCGCLQQENLAVQHAAKQKDLVGRRFGKLVVVAKAPSRKLGERWHGYWECQCDCGRTTTVQRSSLTSRATQSCGCLMQERAAQRATTHGGAGGKADSRWPEYSIWNQMVQRCTNPNSPAYSHYGGRGIRVCERWLKFADFIADVGRRPKPGLQLDRSDNNGNYEPGNVRWTTREENMRNRAFISRKQAEALKQIIRRYLDNHCANADAEGMSALCECRLCLDARALVA